TGRVVKGERGAIARVGRQKTGARTEACQPPQVQRQQPSRKAPATLAAGTRNRQYLRLILDQPRHDEPRKLAAGRCAMSDDMSIDQKTLDFLVAPAAPERRAM